MKERIKAYTIHLSANAYQDRSENAPSDSVHTLAQRAYEPFTVKEPALFRELADRAAEGGVNTLVVAVLDALAYESHPELALPGAWTKEELKTEIDHVRSLGMEPVPMLNFSAAHSVWMGEYRKQISTPAYYRLCEDLIDELCELFSKPKYFILGMEDEYGDRQSLNGYQVVRGSKLFAHDLTLLFDCCRKHGARPWIFNDFHFCSPKEFEKAVPKDVLLSPSRFGLYLPLKPTAQSALDTAAMGYDVVILASDWPCVIYQNFAFSFAEQKLPREQVAGFWDFPLLPCRKDYRYRLIYELLHFTRLNKEYDQKEEEQ